MLPTTKKYAKTEKLNSAIFKQMMLHLNMINNSNTRLCKSIENIDHKLQTIMKADCRVRALALPLPTIPAPFINMLPMNTMPQIEMVEKILSDQNELNDGLKYKEELVCIKT